MRGHIGNVKIYVALSAVISSREQIHKLTHCTPPFPQGYFTGPGLVEMSPDSKRILIIDVYVVLFWFGKYL
jgi:hypothetical protein